MVANCELITRLVILIIFREKIVKLKVFLKKKKKQGNQTTTFANVMKILTILILAVSSLSFIYHS